MVAAAIGNAIDSTPTDTTIPSAPVTVEQTTTTSTLPVVDTTTSATEPNAGGVPTGPGLPSGSPKKSPRTTTAVQDDEVDCNNWEDYVDSGEYDIAVFDNRTDAVLLDLMLADSEGIVTFDAHGTIEYANPTARMCLGIPASVRDFSGVDLTVVMRLDEDTLRVFDEEAFPALVERGNWTGRATYLDLEGTPRLTTVDASRHRGGDGRVFYTLVAHDISEHVELAEQLSRSEAWFRTIVESSIDGIAVTRAGKGIVFASPATERMSGFSAAELVGTRLLDYIHPDDLAEATQLARERTLGDVGARETRLRSADGSYRWVEISAVPFRDDESDAHLITIHDISRRRALEERVAKEDRKSTRLNSSHVALSRMPSSA